jgi:hypothetical protein
MWHVALLEWLGRAGLLAGKPNGRDPYKGRIGAVRVHP